MANLNMTVISAMPTANVKKQKGAKKTMKANRPRHLDSQKPFFTRLTPPFVSSGTQLQFRYSLCEGE